MLPTQCNSSAAVDGHGHSSGRVQHGAAPKVTWSRSTGNCHSQVVSRRPVESRGPGRDRRLARHCRLAPHHASGGGRERPHPVQDQAVGRYSARLRAGFAAGPPPGSVPVSLPVRRPAPCRFRCRSAARLRAGFAAGPPPGSVPGSLRSFLPKLPGMKVRSDIRPQERRVRPAGRAIERGRRPIVRPGPSIRPNIDPNLHPRQV
jgi:hypothetical protein